jgi:hypothetical protein
MVYDIHETPLKANRILFLTAKRYFKRRFLIIATKTCLEKAFFVMPGVCLTVEID